MMNKISEVRSAVISLLTQAGISFLEIDLFCRWNRRPGIEFPQDTKSGWRTLFCCEDRVMQKSNGA